MLTLLTLPTDFMTDMTAYIGELFGDLNPIIVLAIGLPLGFWFIGKVVGIVRSRTR